MKLNRALVAGYVEETHSWIGIFTSTLDGAVTGLKDNAIQPAFQVSHILEELVFFAVVVSVVKADKPPGGDAVELAVDEAFHASFQPLDCGIEALGAFRLGAGWLIGSGC